MNVKSEESKNISEVIDSEVDNDSTINNSTITTNNSAIIEFSDFNFKTEDVIINLGGDIGRNIDQDLGQVMSVDKIISIFDSLGILQSMPSSFLNLFLNGSTRSDNTNNEGLSRLTTLSYTDVTNDGTENLTIGQYEAYGIKLDENDEDNSTLLNFINYHSIPSGSYIQNIKDSNKPVDPLDPEPIDPIDPVDPIDPEILIDFDCIDCCANCNCCIEEPTIEGIGGESCSDGCLKNDQNITINVNAYKELLKLYSIAVFDVFDS